MKINKNFHNKIAQLCLEHFKALPKSGKPNSTEWTILSCIVLEQDNDFSVVALGTGSKCIGQSKMSSLGDIINDSHAEVICRRSFLRFLYTEMNENSSLLIFDKNLKKFSLNAGAKFHFFTTHIPCGDCAIFPKQSSEDFGNVLEEMVGEDVTPVKKRKFNEDIFRTGAKCLLMDDQQDSKLPGKEYHVLGRVRTKPGRGDPTLSVSCSDKIAKWCYLGIQGALISILVDKPIYISSFTLVGGTPYSIESLNRGFYERLGNVKLTAPYVLHRMIIGQSNCTFHFSKGDDKQPCPSSISWCKIKGKCLEVAVEGKRQGVTKKKLNTEFGRLKICKMELFKYFNEICTLKGINPCYNFEKNSYGSMKVMSDVYQQNWIILKDKFRTWTKKDAKLQTFVDNQS